MATKKVRPRVNKDKKHSGFFIKKFLKLAANLLLIIGILLFIFAVFLIWQRNNPARHLAKNYNSDYQIITTENIPVRIKVRDLGIDLPLIPARVINNIWDTTDDGASYIVSSPIPGEIGNSIIYAHDWASLFGPLLRARIGQDIKIEYKDKTMKNFVIKNIVVVENDKTNLLKSGNERILTLYTCTGFLDSKRFVVTAELKNN